MTSTITIWILTFVAWGFASRADIIASPNGTPHAVAAKDARDSLRNLNACAEGTTKSWFHPRGQELVSWVASSGYGERTVSYPPVATSVYLDHGLNGSGGSGFLTINDNQILYTPGVIKPHKWDWVEKATTLTLDLTNRMDARRGLPIVDPRDGIAGAWAEQILWTLHKGQSAYSAPQRVFGLSDANGAVTQIKSSDALTGEAAKGALEVLQTNLRERLLAVPARVAEIYQNRSRLGNERLSNKTDVVTRHPSERFLNRSDVNDVRDGLCRCEGTFEETESVRQQLLAPTSPVRVWENGGPRPLQPADLGCGMV